MVGGGQAGEEMGAQINKFALFVFHLDVDVLVSDLCRRCFTQVTMFLGGA